MTYPTFESLQLENHHGVTTLWLNRPETRNAFNEFMIADLSAALDVLAKDEATRVVVVAGRGTAFCAGADLNWMKKMSGYGYDENLADASALANMLHKLYSLPKPTVARVHGPAFAGGIGMVSVCDIAVASTEAHFKVSEVLIGLTPATISPYLLNAMGEREARRYFLTAEGFDAAEALRIGLLHQVVPPEQLDDAINTMTGHLLKGGPAALAVTKDLIDTVARSPLDQAMLAETAKVIAKIRSTDEGREGIRSFLEKRRPAWLQAK